MPKPRAQTRSEDWSKLARLRLAKVIQTAKELKKLPISRPKAKLWRADVRMVSTAEMRKINAEFLKKNYPTDVLSFPSGDPFFSLGHLGSIVICLPVLKRQAQERGLRPEMELQILLAHATLHLLGLDHETSSRKAAEMAQAEELLLRATVPSKWIGATGGGCLEGLTGRVLNAKK